jgi:FdhE protein
VLQYQEILSQKFEKQRGQRDISATGLRQALDLDEAADSFQPLLEIVSDVGPPTLARYADRLRSQSLEQTHRMVGRWLHAPDASDSGSSFLARVLLQPQAERLASQLDVERHSSAEKLCPVCGFRPQLAVIRPEGDGGKRSLLCSFCMSEWDFRRILCPACGEVNHEKLPRYTADGVAAVRVEACDTCKQYLKSVDMTVDGRAVPAVDEIATISLDLWAVEHDYRKIQLNLMGF